MKTAGRTAFLVAAVLAAVLLAPVLGLAPSAFAQCAMCKTALTSSPEGRHMAGQLNLAIMMMVFSPYVIAATVAGVLFRRQIGAWVRARLPFGG